MFDRLKMLLVNYKKIAAPVKASIWFIICSVLQKGIAFVGVPIFTRMMSTEQYGLYNTYVSWYSIIVAFTSLNLYYGGFNNAMIKYEKQQDQYVSSIQGLIAVLTGFAFVIYLLFQDFFNSLIGMPTHLVLLLFLELLFTPALQLWTVHNRFDFKYKSVVAVTIVKTALNLLLGIVFVSLSLQKDVARIISTVLVEVIVCGIVAIHQFYKGKCFFNKEFWKFAFIFNLPLLPHYLSGMVLNQGDRVMIRNIIGLSAVAFYSVANNLGQIIDMFVNAICTSWTPWIYKELKDHRTINIAKRINMLLLLMVILISGLMFIAPELLRVLAASEYAEAIHVIPPIISSAYFTLIYNVLACIEFYFAERKYAAMGSIAAAIANVGLNYIFINLYGYFAAGYTTLFCYMIFGLSHLIFCKWTVKKHLGNKNLFDQKVILGLSLYIVFLSIIANYLYSFTMLRYCLILVALFILFLKRKIIFSELKQTIL